MEPYCGPHGGQIYAHMVLILLLLLLLLFLPLVSYDPEGFQELDRLQKTTKLAVIIIKLLLLFFGPPAQSSRCEIKLSKKQRLLYCTLI